MKLKRWEFNLIHRLDMRERRYYALTQQLHTLVIMEGFTQSSYVVWNPSEYGAVKDMNVFQIDIKYGANRETSTKD